MRVHAAAFVALLLAAPATAQTAPPAPGAAASAISNLDRGFLIQDAQGGQYELAIAELAQQRSSRDDVKAHAARIISNHRAYNQELQDLGRTKGLALPTTMTAENQARLSRMSAQTGNALDSLYISETTRINAEDKKAAAEVASRTTDADIKAFISKFEAMDAEHERMARALQR